MSNTFTEGKSLTSILEVNDYLNKLFEKLLVTPEPKSARSNLINSPSKESKIPQQILDKETKKNEDDELCIICLENKVSHACIPCGHLKYCEKCVKIIVDRNECAVCRSKVQSVYKIFT